MVLIPTNEIKDRIESCQLFLGYVIKRIEADTQAHMSLHCIQNRLDGVVVERPPLVRDVADSNPGRVIPNTFKMAVIAALLSSLGYLVSITTDWLVSE